MCPVRTVGTLTVSSRYAHSTLTVSSRYAHLTATHPTNSRSHVTRPSSGIGCSSKEHWDTEINGLCRISICLSFCSCVKQNEPCWNSAWAFVLTRCRWQPYDTCVHSLQSCVTCVHCQLAILCHLCPLTACNLVSHVSTDSLQSCVTCVH